MSAKRKYGAWLKTNLRFCDPKNERGGRMNDFVIEIKGLRKTFQDRTAVNGLDLKVPAGSIFGFLGRNGAGKTTTIKLLMGMLKPDAGTASMFGLPVSDPRASIEARRRIGFVT